MALPLPPCLGTWRQQAIMKLQASSAGAMQAAAYMHTLERLLCRTFGAFRQASRSQTQPRCTSSALCKTLA